MSVPITRYQTEWILPAFSTLSRFIAEPARYRGLLRSSGYHHSYQERIYGVLPVIHSYGCPSNCSA